MKSYIQGLITGAVFVFALFVLIGGRSNDSGRYVSAESNLVLDTQTGTMWHFGKLRAELSDEREQ